MRKLLILFLLFTIPTQAGPFHWLKQQFVQDSPRNHHCVVTLAVIMPKAEKPDMMAHLTIFFRPRFSAKPLCRFERNANGNLPTAEWMTVTQDQAVIASTPSELVSFYCAEAP